MVQSGGHVVGFIVVFGGVASALYLACLCLCLLEVGAGRCREDAERRHQADPPQRQHPHGCVSSAAAVSPVLC